MKEAPYFRRLPPLRRLLWMHKVAGGSSSILKTVTGALLHITDALAKPAKKFVATLEPIQDLHGQDSPYPAGGGKNLFNKDGTRLDGYYIANDGSLVENTSGSPCSTYTDYIPVSPSTAYCISGVSSSSAYIRIAEYNEEKTFLGRTLTSQTANPSAAITTKVATKYLRISPDDAVTDIQIEAGSSRSTYAPYSNECPITGHTGANVYRSGADTSNPTTITITFPNAAGTVYGGTLINEGTDSWKLRVDRVSVDLGSLTFTLMSDTASRQAWQHKFDDIKTQAANIAIDALSSQFKPVSVNDTWVSGVMSFTTGNSSFVAFCVNGGQYADHAEFEADMSGVQFVYELATPIEYTLTESQALTLLKGENNIWTDTPESELELTYYAKAE